MSGNWRNGTCMNGLHDVARPDAVILRGGLRRCRACHDAQQERTKARRRGDYHLRLWGAIKTRCYNPKYPLFARYGGRGIRVCDRWLNSYAAFVEDVGQRPTPRHSLDRIDNDGDYTPENCRWATPGQQSSNRSFAHRMDYEGDVVSQAEWTRRWSARSGIAAGTIKERIHLGWPPHLAATLPLRAHLSDYLERAS